METTALLPKRLFELLNGRIPVAETTLPGRQVGEGASPSLDDGALMA